MNQEIIVALIGVFVAVLGGNGFWDFLKSKSGKKSSLEKMVLAIGRDRLNHLCNRFLEQGYIPLDEHDSFIEIGKAYIDMGGNSSIKAKYIRCKELKVR